MKKNAKKVFSCMLLVVTCFSFAITVSAAASITVLEYNQSVQLSENNLNSSFFTRIEARGLNKDTTIQTKVRRKMFNLVWHDSGKTTDTFTHTAQIIRNQWSANGTYDTRATFTNQTSGSTFNGAFGLA